MPVETLKEAALKTFTYTCDCGCGNEVSNVVYNLGRRFLKGHKPLGHSITKQKKDRVVAPQHSVHASMSIVRTFVEKNLEEVSKTAELLQQQIDNAQRKLSLDNVAKERWSAMLEILVALSDVTNS